MRTLFCFIILLQWTSLLVSQELICSETDRQEFEKKMDQLQGLETTDMGNTVVSVGKTFEGAPYVAKTLEINQEETLIVNLREFDCTTYVENVLAFSLLVSKEEEDINAFTSVLRNIRYRDGEVNGYPSRLHYFTDWIADNENKGLVRNISQDLGGEKLEKEINFMSEHRDLYPMLKEDSSVEQIKLTEGELSKRNLYYLPKEAIAGAESRMQNGDIIALATSIDGLDVTHTGFAIRSEDGRIHLLHASSSGQVEITKMPLTDYLSGIKSNIGIIVARPQ